MRQRLLGYLGTDDGHQVAGGVTMAKPIEPTPTLKGKSIDMFCQSLIHSRHNDEKAAYMEDARTSSKKVGPGRYIITAKLKKT